MTAIPRGRSTLGMGGGTVNLNARTKPSLKRGSSSCLGSGPLDNKSSSIRRPATGSKESLISNKLTITDLFLSDKDIFLADESNPEDTKPFIPLPISVHAHVTHTQRQGVTSTVQQQKHASQSKTKLQEYWKTVAQWPAWPELKECRERLQRFKDDFEDGSSNLIRHCGEHLKCAAYVVVCVEKLGVRHAPTMDDDKQNGGLLQPGQMVIVDNVLTFDGVNYLKLRSDGWVFEKKGAIQCMSFMTQVETGLWWYRSVSAELAEIRLSPNFKDAARTGHMLVPGEVIVVALRCVVDGYRWMVLADGRGWIFEMKPPLHGLEASMEERVIAECEEQKPDTEEPSMSPRTGGIVELGMWEYEVMNEVLAIGSSTSGWLLSKGEKISVDMRVPANGLKVKQVSSKDSVTMDTRIWLRLHDGRGWLPKTKANGPPNVRFVKVPTPGSHNPKHQNPTQAEDVDWMSGVA